MSITTAGRSISSGMIAEVTTVQLYPVLMAELNFSTPVRLWSGYGTLTYNSVGYLGMGTLGTISQVDETTDLAARGITMQLSGVPTAYISIALTEDYQGRKCSVMFGALSTTASLIASPITVFSGYMDVMSISDDGNTAAIQMTAENRLVDFRRVRELRYTDEEQQNLFSGDLGLEFVTSIQDKPVYWGNPNQTTNINWTPPEGDSTDNQP